MNSTLDHDAVVATRHYDARLEDLLEQYHRELLELPELPERLNSMWKEWCKLPVDEFHERRTEWLRVLDVAIVGLQSKKLVAEEINRSTFRTPVDVGVITKLITQIRQRRTDLEESWQTKEDAEALIWLENNPMKWDDFEALAKAYPPPQSWYDEDFSGLRGEA